MVEICTICHNNIEQNKNIVITECSHTFHFSCLLKNIKYNQNTGTQCPLCRTRFIPTGNFTTGNFGSYTFINRRVERSVVRPVIRPVVSSTIIRRQNRVIDWHSIKRKRIKYIIEKLTYKQLKKRLKDLNLSTRGYMRTSFEKRLINHLLVVE